ncbi:MAG: helix-turn-helix domain-containing protein [Clostridiales bacterium]|nr:helix-turn-helix domain-containing protein [Clostridiales bacterium]
MVKNIHEFCHLFYNSTSIPIGYYIVSSGQTCCFPPILSDTSVFSASYPEFMQFSRNPDYTVSQSFSYIGYIDTAPADYLVFIGPVFSVPNSDFTLRNFMKEWAISLEYREEISQFLLNSPSISFERFLQILAWLFLCLNDKEININEHFHQDNADKIHELSRLHAQQVYEAKERENYHNSWHFEQKFMQYIRDGNKQKLDELLVSTASSVSEGTLADNALRQRKNVFIITLALVMRSAIAGGMDMEQAYQLADIYTQDCERSQDVTYVSNLTYTMTMDFTERVSQTKIPKGMSQEVFDCIQFIRNHINTPIQVNDVAESIGKSRSYVSGKFKSELGFDISSFIMRCKLEEARSLLASSDKSLSEISTYLCFSSQSYFQNVFKKKYGETPKQYRDRMRQMR